MAVIRRRYIIWLLKAYLKRWGKTIFFSFTVGLIIFFLLLNFYPILIRYIPTQKKEIVGMTGAYTIENIPQVIMQKVSRGLTAVQPDGSIKPDLATSWEIEENGKRYVFHLQQGLAFSDGTRFTSHELTYDFADVRIERPDDYTIIFNLKDAYAPFLVTVAKPVVRKGYIGIGNYTINNIELNGDFVKSIQLLSTKNRFDTQVYIFYPSTDALKVAFALGEVTKATGLTDTRIKNADFTSFPNVVKTRVVNDKQLVTLFYNTTNDLLSDKRLRNSLSYALPDNFSEGEQVDHPYPPTFKYYNAEVVRPQDVNHAKLLIEPTLDAASGSATIEVEMKTLAKYKKTAEEIAAAWEKIGVRTQIEEVDNKPEDFQIYLGDFTVPRDPDQYVLWHSRHPSNITKFKNLRIDKLLEDGRKTVNPDLRLEIYRDFQRYLIEESPATFLYFPYEYEFTKK